METSLLLSMAGFALAMSITPGPVNLVALGSGARHGFAASLRHVVGATLGMGAYGSAGGVGQVALFSGLYLVICLGSIACWAYAGSRLQGVLLAPQRLRWFNRTMALLLLLCAAYLVR